MKASAVVGAIVAALATIPSFAGNAVAAPYDWSGLYVGGHAGYGWSRDSFDYRDAPAGAFAFSFAVGQLPTQQPINSSGMLGGIQFGYNYQTAIAVLGVEADFSWTDLAGSNTYAYPGPAPNAATTIASQSLEWLATFRGRIGVMPLDNWLVYASAGIAVGHTKTQFSAATIPAIVTIDASDSGTRAGWALGGGIEYAISRQLTARLEYLHYDLGRESFSGHQLTSGVPQPFAMIIDYRFTGDIVRVGLNYRFATP